MNVLDLLAQVEAFKTVWKTYTPSVSSTVGTITAYTASGRYLQVGKTLYLSANVQITNNGNGAGAITVSLPSSFSAVVSQIINGRESQTTNNALTALASGSNLNVLTYNNAYPGGTNYTIVLSGVVEVQ